MLTTTANTRLRNTEKLELGPKVTQMIERESTTARGIRRRDITGRAVDALIGAMAGK